MAQRKTAIARRREQIEKEKERRAKRQRTMQIGGGVVALVALLAAGFLFWQGPAAGENSNSEETNDMTLEGNGTLMESERPLADLEPAERDGHYRAYPEMVIDPENEYQAVIRTERGDMLVELFAEDAPKTVNNFVFLANEGFYDGVTFHRVLESFMAQGGDPGGSGRGGPGYRFEDETNSGLTFDRPGLLAMANAGPNTNGSQFFITFVPTPHLNGAHTIFGEVVEGEEVLSQITRRQPGAATPADVIERVDIYEAEG
jgi:cyclophilin family peptidyl-prolyl cis-trans isomerase